MCRLLDAAAAKEEIRFMILRGEAKFEVPIETRVLLQPTGSGGVLEPRVR